MAPKQKSQYLQRVGREQKPPSTVWGVGGGLRGPTGSTQGRTQESTKGTWGSYSHKLSRCHTADADRTRQSDTTAESLLSNHSQAWADPGAHSEEG